MRAAPEPGNGGTPDTRGTESVVVAPVVRAVVVPVTVVRPVRRDGGRLRVHVQLVPGAVLAPYVDLPVHRRTAAPSSSTEVTVPGEASSAAETAASSVTGAVRGAFRPRSSSFERCFPSTLPLPASTVTSCHPLSEPYTSSSQTSPPSSSSSSASVTVPGTDRTAAAAASPAVTRAVALLAVLLRAVS